jgi:hypothetical protein
MAGVLRQISVRGLFAGVVLLIVAMTLGGIERNRGRAAWPLVALIVLGDRLDVFGEGFCHCSSPLAHGEKTPLTGASFPPSSRAKRSRFPVRPWIASSREFLAMTGEILHLVLAGGLALPLGLLLLLLALVGFVTAIQATRGGTQHAMMAGIMTGDAADYRTLDAALGLG